MIKSTLRQVLGVRTRSLLYFDYLRLRARIKNGRKKDLAPSHNQLHLGCGRRRVENWLNVDVVGSEFDVDLAAGRLPWRDGVFRAVLSQHVIEHLDLKAELLPLLRELHRVMSTGGELWLSCPDMRKVFRSYHNHNMEDLLADRQARFPQFNLNGMPNSYLVNHLFHQSGEHKNLFDFGLLNWALQTTGFTQVKEVNEATLLGRFPEFPIRNDDLQSLYVTAVKA